MNVMNIIQSMSALSGIAVIAFGTLWLKQYLKHCFCF